MTYADLADRLETDPDPDPRRVTALPDGSVDTFYRVSGDAGESIASAADFGERVAEGTESFETSRTARRPGGQSVNMARQVHALGDDAALFGHLDDPAFDELGFETHSFGDPSEIRVLDFDDREVLLAETAESVRSWTLADMESVARSATEQSSGRPRDAVDEPDAALSAPAVCCGNWVSARGLTDAFRTLGERDTGNGIFVLDPGRLPSADPDRVRDLFDALRTLESSYDVVVSVNRAELAYAAESLGCGGDAEANPERVAADLRDEADLAGVVMHATAEAVSATPGGVHRVPNLEVPDPVRHTGSGDRFSAALAHALVREWDWPVALALGNLASAYHVATDQTGDRAELRSFLRSHDPKE